jgi:molecular chaperone GrpE
MSDKQDNELISEVAAEIPAVDNDAPGPQAEAAPDNGAPAATDAPAAPAADTTSDLQAEVRRLAAEAADYKDQWLRATADYRNYKRRAEIERAEIIRHANAALLLKLLPVMDDLDRAMANVPQEIAASPWYAGFALIPQKLHAILESEGVTPIDALGQEFDPTLHEAVIHEEREGEHGKVTGELQKGYRLHDKVLRPTMVKVG